MPENIVTCFILLLVMDSIVMNIIKMQAYSMNCWNEW